MKQQIVHIILNNKVKVLAILLLLIFVVFVASKIKINPLFTSSYSTALVDKNGDLLAAKIANDGQWRFKSDNAVPQKFAMALLQFEDRKFYNHAGVRWESIFRALYQNIRSNKVVSGGSTITMQVVRLSKNNPTRSVFNKFIEILNAYCIELFYSKQEILSFYSNHAPFGGNVVGLNAAAWRYYNKSADKLSWAESALLAVLPNAPSLLYPGKNEIILKNKRDKLLKQLCAKGLFTPQDLALYMQEPLPLKPFRLPEITPHLLDRLVNEKQNSSIVVTSIDKNLQENILSILSKHHNYLSSNLINNHAVLVLDVANNKVLAYVGNAVDVKNRNSNQVDIVNAKRSTGSILKPFLYGAMLNEGELLPGTIVYDIPTQISDFVPENSSLDYDGAVSAKYALARSLNIPAVRMLQQYSYERFYDLLKKLGITSLNKPASHYGLSLILGGAEASLWDVCNVYASLSRQLNNYTKHQSNYDKNDKLKASFLYTKEKLPPNLESSTTIGAGAIFKMFEAIVEVARPEEDAVWKQFSSSKKIAWKTGTSFGNRDAWAIGTTPDYVVGVWVGNASGEGRAELTGIGSAAPILFDVFNLLPQKNKWFVAPFDDLTKVMVCKKSGQRYGEYCETKDSIWVPIKGKNTELCKYHKQIYTDASGLYRVSDKCVSVSEMIPQNYFVLPPTVEFYYKQKNPLYKSLPPYKQGCDEEVSVFDFELIYPKAESKIFIPIDLSGKKGKVIFKAAHRSKTQTLYWHIDDNFIESTSNGYHQISFNLAEGLHKLTLTDSYGNTVVKSFEIISK
ncbi:MAG: penicillin-binding protein 1C [Bacteroidota bacterium]